MAIEKRLGFPHGELLWALYERIEHQIVCREQLLKAREECKGMWVPYEIR